MNANESNLMMLWRINTKLNGDTKVPRGKTWKFTYSAPVHFGASISMKTVNNVRAIFV